MEYYIEYIIFQEFIVDFILLYMTGALLNKKIILKRLIIAAIIGVSYSIVFYSLNREFLNYNIIKFIFSVFFLTVAYSPSGIIDYIKVILCFYILSILIMGVMVLSYFVFDSRLTIVLLFATIFIVYMMFKVLFHEIKSSMENKNYFREIKIYLDGNITTVIGFIDTGNELVDTLTNKPVVIVDIDYIKDLLDDNTVYEIKKAYANGNNYLMDFMLKQLNNYNFRLLKYETISSCNEYMIGIVPSKTLIIHKDKSFYIECVIGIYPKRLCDDNKFQALLYKKILSWEGESVDANEYY